ncbi:hypothetical protein [Legionella sp. CNM-4043-24]|uniref:hypothetical protein n=1 Tax=Legionella sp. CNM-4043-24 TaxID=3421646 RepID=UPI00403AC31C
MSSSEQDVSAGHPFFSTPAPRTSLQFSWKGGKTYCGGTITSLNIYIDGVKKYKASLLESDGKLHLRLRNLTLGTSIECLRAQDLNKLKKLSITIGVSYSTLEEEEFGIEYDTSKLQSGEHYTLEVTQQLKIQSRPIVARLVPHVPNCDVRETYSGEHIPGR